MADEENIQDTPSEVVENEEAKEEPKENDVAETPAESGNAEDKANDEAANTAESSEIPPPEEAVKEDVTADGEEKGEQDETNNEIAVDSTEEEKANEQVVVETTDGGGDAETAEKDENVQDKGTDGEAAETAEATSEEKVGSPTETPVMTDEIEKQNEAPTEDVAEDALDTGEDKDGAPTGEQPQEGQAEVAETTDTEADVENTEKPAEAEDNGEEKPASPIPQSDTFQDGERPETPTVQVPEPISREASPKEEPQHLDAGTPEMEESPRHEDIIEEEEEEEDEPFYSREELLEAFQAALAEREQLQNHNTQLQHKLAEYFRKKKSDDQRQEMDKNVTDQEQRYLKYMSNLEELRNQEEEERENFQVHLEELKEKKQEKLELVEKEDKTFTELKRTVALEAISSRTGKPLMPREVEMYISNEQRKEEEVKSVRLDNIKLKNRLKKREQQLKAKEELAEGLHLIDFEQLKIENQTYNEKIEERNEELLKLRKKITSTVQVLTHVKEKLQFVQGENQVQKSTLRDVEAHVAQKRDLLSRTKKARDSLRIDNQKLRQKSGLLGNKALLRDFEERKDEGEELRSRLDRLKRQHAELILKSAGVKKKIDETRA